MADYLGIDVSRNQGTINWKKVADSGVKIVILRVTAGYGSSKSSFQEKDLKFDEYVEGINKYNDGKAADKQLKVGVYRYSYAKNLAQMNWEADGVVNALRGITLSYPVFLDIEDEGTQGKISQSDMQEMIYAFKNKIEAAGHKFGIYTGKNWYFNKNISQKIKNDKNIAFWIARYGTNNGKKQESVRCKEPEFTNCVGWQYTSMGNVNGISGNVDMNVFYINPSETFKVPTYTPKTLPPVTSRESIVKTIKGWEGATKGSKKHHKIIDTYNSYLQSGEYVVSYSDPWCMATAQAAWRKNGIAIPMTASCGVLITLLKQKEEREGHTAGYYWVEKDSYVPSIGDGVLYNWNIDGSNYASTNNTAAPDHVGIVTKVNETKKTFESTEGNTHAADDIHGTGPYMVATKTRNINGKNIRGFVKIRHFLGNDTASKEEVQEKEDKQKDSAVLNQSIIVKGEYTKDKNVSSNETVPASKAEDVAADTLNVPVEGLKEGDTGNAVKAMQLMLDYCGFSCGTDSGTARFGSATKKAVKNFQKSVKLSKTGIYDEATKQALVKAYNGNFGEATVQTTGSAVRLYLDKNVGSTSTPYISVPNGGKLVNVRKNQPVTNGGSISYAIASYNGSIGYIDQSKLKF